MSKCTCNDVCPEHSEQWDGNPMQKLHFAGHEYILSSVYKDLQIKYEKYSKLYMDLSSKYLELAAQVCELEKLKSARLKLIKELEKRNN